jgi:hypothetical protein
MVYSFILSVDRSRFNMRVTVANPLSRGKTAVVECIFVFLFADADGLRQANGFHTNFFAPVRPLSHRIQAVLDTPSQ